MGSEKLDWAHYAIQLDQYRKRIDDALNMKDYSMARKLWHEQYEISLEFYRTFENG